MASDRRDAVVREIRKLAEAGTLRETKYHTWVSNPVMVKKPDGTWRMCIDFKDLNKACPKDAYPLPEMDFKVDSLVPFRYKCFLDAYKGYHQIKMSREDEEKMAFHTDIGIFCYTKMPFGLRNAGATYQHLMDKAFEKQIGRNLEVYVDDIVIKSREEKQMLEGIEETFQKLREYNIKLNPKKCSFGVEEVIKGQVIADFLAEIPDGEVIQDPLVNNIPESSIARQTWNLYTDGSSSGKGSGAGLMLISLDEIKLMYAMLFGFKCSNNEAEYEALLAGLRMAQSMGATWVNAYVDSLLVNNQVNETYEAKDETMEKYLAKTKELITSFENVTLNHVHRGRNQIVDALSKLATSGMEKKVKWETLQSPSIESREVSAVTSEEPCWYTPILKFLTKGELPSDRGDAQKIQTKALQYEVNNGILYRKSYLGPLLRCVSPAEAKYLIQEIHAGICGIHAESRAVVAKIQNAGYYWPGMHEDAVEELRKCRSCQKFAPQTLRPKNNLILVTAAWPFQKWVVDIVGPFPLAPGKLKYLIVVVDYFTKWVEAKPLAKLTAETAKKFLWEYIVCRFGLPLYLVSDNGTQFTDKVLQDWCAELQIQQIFTSVAHPQGNGQVERANRGLLDGIKRRLGFEGSSWDPTGGLDLLEERREAAAISVAKYKKTLEKYYNQRVAQQTFKEGEYVMRDNEASRAKPSGKLGPNWEGPYIVQEDLGKGAYRLSRLDGTAVPHSWNAAQLKKCYM
ncbi:uncharacterized protein LOC110897289 [Helianthus annuus]|uniref:uncharacterized protein LOC110897289 n=1 Tax=Helianthus annuus TaxID=4232 RepID=UPI000B8FB9E4|nr:uncharacterized protein LOC110897289 [Helianthus annuus]